VIHRRGDSFSSLRSEEGEADAPDAPGPRPIFFIHGVGLGLVCIALYSFKCYFILCLVRTHGQVDGGPGGR
jgi:hypothetical protein